MSNNKTIIAKSKKGTIIGFLNEYKKKDNTTGMSINFSDDMLAIIAEEGRDCVVTLLNKIVSIETLNNENKVTSSKEV